jgi:membrane protein DedA with SNARE-associated domain
MAERGLVMTLHSAVIAVVLYLLMTYVLGQSNEVAEDRSVLLGAVVLAYMVLFGHGMPNKVNSNIY